jgi:hypothetical protein
LLQQEISEKRAQNGKKKPQRVSHRVFGDNEARRGYTPETRRVDTSIVLLLAALGHFTSCAVGGSGCPRGGEKWDSDLGLIFVLSEELVVGRGCRCGCQRRRRSGVAREKIRKMVRSQVRRAVGQTRISFSLPAPATWKF